MEANKKYVKRSFFIHQYEEEAAFLGNMRKEGWKFTNLHMGIPTKYEFDKCEPGDYIYQLDFVSAEEDKEDYHQLYNDCGWEEIFSWFAVGGRWYYFCREAEGITKDIYTDVDSKINLFDRIWKRYSLVLVICMLFEINAIGVIISGINGQNLFSYLGIAGTTCIIIFSGVIFFAVYNIFALQKKKNILKKQKERMI